MPQVAIQSTKPEYIRLLRFMIVGASGTLLDFMTLTLLKEVVLLPTVLANAASFSVGVVNNYTWNRRWTFDDARQRPIRTQFLQFVTVSVVGLLLNTLLVLALEAPLGTLFGVAAYGYLPAKVIATGIVFLWNFTANRLWTFNTFRKHEEATS